MDNNENVLPVVSRLDLLQQAQVAYGIDAEIDVAIEELSELTKALLKHRRATNFATLSCNTALDSKSAKQDVYEEIADVIIVLTQLVLIFDGKSEVRKQLDAKIARFEERINGAALQNVPLADLGLSTRVYNALTRADIYNLYDLSKRDLTKVHNLGKIGITEVNKRLGEFTKEHEGV